MQKMPDKSSKYNILLYLIQLDKSLSSSLSLAAAKSSPLGQYRTYMKALEYSSHGAFWISGVLIMICLSDDPKKEAFFLNLLFALVLDVVFASILKAAIRRERPANNKSEDMLMTYSVDKMSCPSGHTSIAVTMTYILIACTPNMYLLHLILVVWCLCICASRILLGRHYIGDVLLGVVLGYVDYLIIDYVWAGPETAKWYINIFKDSDSVIDAL